MNKKHLYFIIIASMVILFINLGMPDLWGSEGRWAVIAKYMFSSGDLFNPMLGIFPYWDKPLLSYWQILPAGLIVGAVNEFTARTPSVLWGILMLILTYDLARRWFDEHVAFFSALILLTSYGFIFWGRNAQVEMTNASVILLALWYFWFFTVKRTFKLQGVDIPAFLVLEREIRKGLRYVHESIVSRVWNNWVSICS